MRITARCMRNWRWSGSSEFRVKSSIEGKGFKFEKEYLMRGAKMTRKYKKVGDGSFPRYPKSTTNDDTFKVTYYRKTLLEAIETNTGHDGWCDARDLELELGCTTAYNYETFEFCVCAGVIKQDVSLSYLFRITPFGEKWMQKKKDNREWYKVKVKVC